MSQQLISRSPDLKRLRDEGYNLQVVSSYLIVRDIPYVNSSAKVRRGVLVTDLSLAGNVTTRPSCHTIMFKGEHPCHQDGSVIKEIQHQARTRKLSDGLEVNFSFSCKPIIDGQRISTYADYYQKITTYIDVISAPANSLAPQLTARTYNLVLEDEACEPFKYMDTSSSRSDISDISNKLSGYRLAIVGLGGSGSYLLDLIVKTPVQEINLFDGDRYQQHNAFRSPGATAIEILKNQPYKADYYANQYSKLHRGIVAHNLYLDYSNISCLAEMDFVFICIDRPETKREIVAGLEQMGRTFIDAGMGLGSVDQSLFGQVRATVSTPNNREHFRRRVSLGDNSSSNNEYSRNIQIVELNALNAIMAIVKWKKLLGFYLDDGGELCSVYNVANNKIYNED